MTIGDIYKYAAFISYAHTDEGVARRLHNALETYPLPKGMDVSKRAQMTPIFRDVTELTAHHSLSEKIRDAVETSRFLIVLCSPAAKASHWVNEEIRLFRSLHGEGAILAVIVDGAPDTAFPPALLEDGREPLAADISGREGFKFGTTQLAASMLGVGLDQLVQRDQKRRRVRTQALAGVTTAIALVMGGLAWNAVDARDEAETSRNEAEKMVEFMIKDLKQDLEQIGKLNILNGVGKRVGEYYDAIPVSDMDDDRLGRRSRARHLLGQVALDQGEYDRAETELQAAYNATAEILKRAPDNTEAIFNHAQSEYWLGAKHYYSDNYLETLSYWEQYSKLSKVLFENDKNNHKMVMEVGMGAQNLGLVFSRLENIERAQVELQNAIHYFELAGDIEPENLEAAKELANVYSWGSSLEAKAGNSSAAIELRRRQFNLYDELFSKNPKNVDLRYRRNQSNFRLLKLKKSPVCSDTNFTKNLADIKNLIEFEPDNKRWAKEYLKQLHFNILECLNERSNTTKKNTNAFFTIANRLRNDNDVNQLVNQLVTHPNYIDNRFD